MTRSPLVALIGADRSMQAILHYLFEDDGCTVIELADASALDSVERARKADLIVITDHPHCPSVGTIAAMRSRGYSNPLLLLTRGADFSMRRRAFALGVIDIIGIPLAPHNLQARLRAALGDRHQRVDRDVPRSVVRAGGLTLSLHARELTDGTGRTISLAAGEVKLLAVLMSAPGRVFGRQDLLDAVWGERYQGDGNALVVSISRLRAKLASTPLSGSPMRTRRGQGYVFDARAVARPALAMEDTARPILAIEDAPRPLVS